MVAGPPPGRVELLLTAWADWLFEKLSPPRQKPSSPTQPLKLVEPNSRFGQVSVEKVKQPILQGG